LLFVILWFINRDGDLHTLSHFAGGVLLSHLKHNGVYETLFSIKKNTSYAHRGLKLAALVIVGSIAAAVWSSYNDEICTLEPTGSVLRFLFGWTGFQHAAIRCWGGMAVIMTVQNSGWLQRFFGSRPLHFLGRISFSYYLIHGYVCALLIDVVGRELIHRPVASIGTWIISSSIGRRDPSNLPTPSEWFRAVWLYSLVPPLLVSILLAHLFEIYVDRPSIQLGHSLMRLLESEEPPLKGYLGSKWQAVRGRLGRSDFEKEEFLSEEAGR
jgi:peptidoglycan/LPS O-acetylase OafA/YrhL